MIRSDDFPNLKKIKLNNTIMRLNAKKRNKIRNYVLKCKQHEGTIDTYISIENVSKHWCLAEQRDEKLNQTRRKKNKLITLSIGIMGQILNENCHLHFKRRLYIINSIVCICAHCFCWRIKKNVAKNRALANTQTYCIPHNVHDNRKYDGDYNFHN